LIVKHLGGAQRSAARYARTTRHARLSRSREISTGCQLSRAGADCISRLAAYRNFTRRADTRPEPEREEQAAGGGEGDAGAVVRRENPKTPTIYRKSWS
jgi:hypothetical protein